MESSKTPFSSKNGALRVSARSLEMRKGKSCLRNPPVRQVSEDHDQSGS